MKSITLEEAIRILENCSAVVIDNVVTYPGISWDTVNDKPDERFLDLSWIDEDFQNFQINFYTQDNETIQIVGSSMFLIDERGDECQLTILAPMELI